MAHATSDGPQGIIRGRGYAIYDEVAHIMLVRRPCNSDEGILQPGRAPQGSPVRTVVGVGVGELLEGYKRRGTEQPDGPLLLMSTADAVVATKTTTRAKSLSGDTWRCSASSI